MKIILDYLHICKAIGALSITHIMLHDGGWETMIYPLSFTKKSKRSALKTNCKRKQRKQGRLTSKLGGSKNPPTRDCHTKTTTKG